MMKTEQAIENKQSITKQMIAEDLNAGHWDALYFAREEQISELIDAGEIDEDFSSRYQDYQEEMRCMMSEFSL